MNQKESTDKAQRPRRAIAAADRGIDYWRTVGAAKGTPAEKSQLRARSSLSSLPESWTEGFEFENEDQALEGVAYLDALMETSLGQEWIVDDDVDALANAQQNRAKTKDDVIKPMSRRKQAPGGGLEQPPMARRVKFKARFLPTTMRLFVWVSAVLRFTLFTLVDKIRGKDTTLRRAVRLREILESLGPTFIKIGQQMSIRADVLSYQYCLELSKMLDSIGSFDTAYAIERVEAVTGKKLEEVFALFDPEPIGSASLACVYQAKLVSGERVAVKVRRPGVGELLACDLRALAWIMDGLELFSILRTGITRNVRMELETMLMEELNFEQEARYTEIFRQQAESTGQTHIGAPIVYHQYSGADVLVTEFVSGVFLKEVLSALDRQDKETLASMEAKGMDPAVIASNLVQAFNWEAMESLFFHADPHPANIIVRPGNRLVFIDFGSCGRFSSKQKRLWLMLHHYMEQEDVHGMVDCSISMLEPLPPIDVDRFTKEVEALYWNLTYAMKDPYSEWWERASGIMWMQFVAISRKYNIPMNLDTIRLFRATFLYDTLMYRLWEKMDMDDEYRKYSRSAGKRARKRVRKAVERRVRKGLRSQDYVRIETIWDMVNQIQQRTQHFLDSPEHRFSAMLGKAAFGVSIVLRVATLAVLAHLIAIAVHAAYNKWTGAQIDVWTSFKAMLATHSYQFVVALFLFVILRKALMRVEDVDAD